eukprot:CAMPEP_0171193196 /NCGR_PEP_ID=MMETSP0790-20130122/20255_1 /TAXON_ID=2925 /ORGANISM="Alexandrium catenella, Strain OF101" /LENGTH=131 /DNA_ID=CAMNT_0011658367 /DNA_START=281 /DNA_END=673 /DNA_ORIENTATION=-
MTVMHILPFFWFVTSVKCTKVPLIMVAALSKFCPKAPRSPCESWASLAMPLVTSLSSATLAPSSASCSSFCCSMTSADWTERATAVLLSPQEDCELLAPPNRLPNKAARWSTLYRSPMAWGRLHAAANGHE